MSEAAERQKEIEKLKKMYPLCDWIQEECEESEPFFIMGTDASVPYSREIDSVYAEEFQKLFPALYKEWNEYYHICGNIFAGHNLENEHCFVKEQMHLNQAVTLFA